jgi:hypothetical protein
MEISYAASWSLGLTESARQPRRCPRRSPRSERFGHVGSRRSQPCINGRYAANRSSCRSGCGPDVHVRSSSSRPVDRNLAAGRVSGHRIICVIPDRCAVGACRASWRCCPPADLGGGFPGLRELVPRPAGAEFGRAGGRPRARLAGQVAGIQAPSWRVLNRLGRPRSWDEAGSGVFGTRTCRVLPHGHSIQAELHSWVGDAAYEQAAAHGRSLAGTRALQDGLEDGRIASTG